MASFGHPKVQPLVNLYKAILGLLPPYIFDPLALRVTAHYSFRSQDYMFLSVLYICIETGKRLLSILNQHGILENVLLYPK